MNATESEEARMEIQQDISPREPPELTVVVPCYNEVATIATMLDELIRAIKCSVQIVVVDDASTDGTWLALQEFSSGLDGIRVEIDRLDKNRGKGSAVRRGLELARGRFVVIQDADREYDPADLNRLLEVARGNPGSAVYGSRYLNAGRHQAGAVANYYGVKTLNLVLALLYGKRISDSATCYKMLARETFARLELTSERFELCPEINSKLCRLSVPIIEVPVSYRPRKKSEGKKIRLRDFWEALKCYARHSKWNPDLLPDPLSNHDMTVSGHKSEGQNKAVFSEVQTENVF